MKAFISNGITFIPILSKNFLQPGTYYLYDNMQNRLILEQIGSSTFANINNYRTVRSVAKVLKKLNPNIETVYVLASTRFVPIRYKQIPCVFCTEVDNCTDEECRQEIEQR